MKRLIFFLMVSLTFCSYGQESTFDEYEIASIKYDTSRSMKSRFYYSINDARSIEGFILTKQNEINITLFSSQDSTYGEKWTLLTHNPSLERKTYRLVRKISKYPKIPCYSAIEIRGETGVSPEVDLMNYWQIQVKYYRRKEEIKKVFRHKVLLDDSTGCNTKKRMIKERSDIQSLLKLLNEFIKENNHEPIT